MSTESNVLYFSQYFHPEIGATQNRALAMTSALRRAGFQVDVVCEIPNHPSGVVHNGYGSRLVQSSALSGMDVHYVWVKTSPNKSKLGRLIFYLTYAFTALLAGLFAVKNSPAVVIASSPPPFVGLVGYIVARLRRAKFVYDIRDMWPEVALDLGEMREGLVANLLRRISALLYKRADIVVTVTQGLDEAINRLYSDVAPVAVLPNGSDTDHFLFKPEGRARVRSQLDIEEKFAVFFGGLIGLVLDVETLLEAAALLLDNPRFEFLIAGGGPLLTSLRASVAERNLTNVNILGEIELQEMPNYLSAADLTIAPYRDSELMRAAVPTKIFDSMACSRPVILGMRGEAAAILEASGGGIAIAPESPSELSNAIIKLSADTSLLETMGEKGLEYVTNHRSRATIGDRLAKIVSKLV